MNFSFLKLHEASLSWVDVKHNENEMRKPHCDHHNYHRSEKGGQSESTFVQIAMQNEKWIGLNEQGTA